MPQIGDFDVWLTATHQIRNDSCRAAGHCPPKCPKARIDEQIRVARATNDWRAGYFRHSTDANAIEGA